MIKLKVKFMENFKDGNVLGGRFFKVGQVETVSEIDAHKIEQSGGVIEVQEQIFLHPGKQVIEVEKSTEETKPVEVKRKAGRPKKK